jgi:hypothetical protein
MDNDNPLPSHDDAAARATDAATQAWETTRDKAGEALQSGERYVRANPGTSVLSIFGIGFLLGLLVGYGMAHEDDYSTRARKFAKRWGKNLNLD